MNYKNKIMLFMNIELHKKLQAYSKGYKWSIFRIVIFNVINSIVSIGLAIITKVLIDSAMSGEFKTAVYYGVTLAVVLLFEMLLMSYITYFTVRVKENMRNSIQLNALSELYSKKWMQLNNFKIGDLVSRLYSDVDSIVTALINTIPMLIALMIQLFMAFGLLYTYDSLLALLTFLVTPVTILFGMVIGQRIKVVQKKIQEADALKHSIINESLQNIIILKSFNYISRNISRVKSLQNEHFKLIKRKSIISIKSNLMLGFGYQLGFFGAVTFGAFRLASQAISVGTFTAFIQLVGQIQAPIQGLASSLPQLIASLSSVERINEIYDIENDWQPDNVNLQNGVIPTKISINNISFAYNENSPVFSDLNMTVKRGEKIAIVGPSGEGKTTLVHMLLSLIEPDTGDITIETNSGGSVPLGVSTRRFFSYVPQVNTLFSGSIYDNFLLNHEVSEETIEKALIASCCKSFIDELPDGLDTLMGERGIGLSQGQAQRITIARALLHETPFLVFDEATSALDFDTEHELINNLKQYYPQCTLIAMTHRESIFGICDRVYWMKNGGLIYET